MARKSRKNTQLGMKEEKEMVKYNAAIYARLSVEDRGQEAASVENQILIAYNFLENHKDLNFVDTYIDTGQTGTNFNRPAFSRLMEDIEKGKITCIIVKDLSRFGRNYLETGNYLDYIFPYMGVRFISVNDNFDSKSINNTDALMVSLKSILHDHYAKDISKKVSTAIDIKKKAGKYMNRMPPYGYVLSQGDKYKLEVHQEQKEVIRCIYRWRLEGVGPSAIARKLNDMEVPTLLKYRFLEGYSDGKEDALWHGSTVLNILKNPCYLGCLVERKTQKALYKGGLTETLPQWTIIRNTHEAIISEESFEEVQKLFAQAGLNNESGAKPLNRERKENVFRGLLICGECGSVLQRDRGYYRKDGTWIQHYNCPKKYKKKGVCGLKSIREDVLQQVVFALCKSQLSLFLDMNEAMEDGSFLVKQDKNGNVKEIEVLEMEGGNEKKQRDYKSFQNNFFSESNKRLLNEPYASLAVEDIKAKNAQVFRAEWIHKLLQFKNSEKLTNEMCRLFIEKIIIKNNCFSVHFAYQSEYEAIKALEKKALRGG
ncbi:recombinase family protein [Anaerotignum sp. MB30-C6]|uniref:recombinase family protein n=1 Tax=Anaerotignum sp. MB30-C6 TaxID=3070814 RepID=UPI0027DDE44F|nr:recombinase family protein [Anaerotignum sp. MB30-C6]WMI82311.1 recombinase family protein [Anaerotignum sp. MB30-C6]